MASARTSQSMDWSIVFGSAVLGTLISNGFAAIMMACAAERNPAEWASFTAEKAVQLVTTSSVVGAVGFGLFSYSMLCIRDRANAENERFLAMQNKR